MPFRSGLARFYFQLTDNTVIKDREGEAYSDLAAAERHARQVAREVGRNKSPREVESRSVSVIDEQGKQVFKTPVVPGER